jgi:hypothetical protein
MELGTFLLVSGAAIFLFKSFYHGLAAPNDNYAQRTYALACFFMGIYMLEQIK